MTIADDIKAPPKPWPFPPIHVMPTEPNGTEPGCWHCVRCGVLIKRNGSSIFTLVRRCNEERTPAGRQGRAPYRVGGTGNRAQ